MADGLFLRHDGRELWVSKTDDGYTIAVDQPDHAGSGVDCGAVVYYYMPEAQMAELIAWASRHAP
jgi:hypothetical protein